MAGRALKNRPEIQADSGPDQSGQKRVSTGIFRPTAFRSTSKRFSGTHPNRVLRRCQHKESFLSHRPTTALVRAASIALAAISSESTLRFLAAAVTERRFASSNGWSAASSSTTSRRTRSWPTGTRDARRRGAKRRWGTRFATAEPPTPRTDEPTWTRVKVVQAVLAGEGAKTDRPALWRIKLDLVTLDGELRTERLKVPSAGYPDRRMWDAVCPDLDAAAVIAPDGWRLAARLVGRELDVAFRDGRIVRMRAAQT
jgi:hypothetical protein